MPQELEAPSHRLFIDLVLTDLRIARWGYEILKQTPCIYFLGLLQEALVYARRPFLSLRYH